MIHSLSTDAPSLGAIDSGAPARARRPQRPSERCRMPTPAALPRRHTNSLSLFALPPLPPPNRHRPLHPPRPGLGCSPSLFTEAAIKRRSPPRECVLRSLTFRRIESSSCLTPTPLRRTIPTEQAAWLGLASKFCLAVLN